MNNSTRREVLKLIGGLGLLPSTSVFGQDADRTALRIAMQDLRVELDPLHPRATALVSFRVLESIYDKLFAIDYQRDGQIRPMLAESMEALDSTTYRVSLRKGVRFHDGEELTAEDVAFTFGAERMLAKDSPGYGVGQISFPSMSAVRATDRHTVEFRTKVPDPVLSNA